MILFGKIQSRCLVSEWKRAAWYQSERVLLDFNGQEGSPIQSYLSCDFLEIRMPIKNGFFCLAVVPQQKSFLGKFEKAGLAGTEALSYVQIRWGKQLAFISGLSYRLASLAVCGELLGVHHMFHSSISDAFYWWSQQKVIWRSMFIICLWSIWKARNNSIFNSIHCFPADIFSKVMLSYGSLPFKAPKEKEDVLPSGPLVSPSFHMRIFWWCWTVCGCRVYILINESCHFSIHWNGGRGSNSKAKAMALDGLLYFCSFLDISDVSIFGNSKVMVDFVLKENNISMPHLAGWMNRIRALWDDMYDFSIKHISGSQNLKADSLSKKGLSSSLGLWFVQILFEEEIFTIQEFSSPVF